ncbi:integration host factor, actinobacterial type [Flaviflexus equikiangi]|uniref:Integration host factor n=1 Tax=Flaviflexus equikiangi TaxID=2758573 RepID=A0ABS2THR6_9ACTO|nr:integration host factor, actinobacterial type [Flaviflexus equikiangi]MBM9434191.1 integration host factor [Flaviflexus equikiangi]
MALPSLTPEQRQAALDKAAVARKKRAELKQSLKAGETRLSEVLELAKNDEIIAKLRVSALLESMPGIGTAKARAIMDRTNISPSRRVGGLGPHQAAALVKLFS